MVANSSTFQTLGGFADADAALSSVYTGVVDIGEEKDLMRPLAVVYLGETVASKSIGTGALVDTFTARQVVYVGFECDVPASEEKDYRDAPQDAYVHFLNQLGAFLQDLVSCPRSVHSLNVQSIALSGEVMKNDSNAAEWHAARIRIEVGLGR